MKRGWLGLALVGMLVLLMGAGSSEVVAQEDAAPYLYYYSQTHNGFVIERADGTDSHIIDMQSRAGMPKGGPGWSVTGRWLAWTTEINQTNWIGPSDPSPVAVSIDGRRVTALDDFTIAYTAWSPTADLLAVVSGFGFNLAPPYHIRVAVIDPARDAVIIETEVVSTDPDFSNPTVAWTANGQFVVATFGDHIPTHRMGLTVLVINLQGGVVKRYFDDGHVVRPDGIIEFSYRTGATSQTAIENAVTGQQINVDFLGGYHWWRADYQSAWAVSESTSNGSPPETTQTLWLVEDNNTNTLVRDGLLAISHLYVTPQGEEVFFLLKPHDPHIYRFNPSTGVETVLTSTLPNEAVDPLEVKFVWATDGQFNVRYSTPSQQYNSRYYDLWNDRETEYVSLGKRDTFSASGRYAAHVEEGAVITDLWTGAVLALPPHSESLRWFFGGETHWHPEADWVMVALDTTIAGGSSPYRLLSVTNPDGTVQRELTYCFNSPYCFGWLPDFVDPSLIPPNTEAPPYPTPTLRLSGNPTWGEYLAWTPDSQQVLKSFGHDQDVAGYPPTGGASLAVVKGRVGIAKR